MSEIIKGVAVAGGSLIFLGAVAAVLGPIIFGLGVVWIGIAGICVVLSIVLSIANPGDIIGQ